MAEAVVVQPDTEFIERVIASGGGDLKKCYQCATCSVICELSPEDAPFPRRQMVAAQWGMREQLCADPALWLCHNCGKCTEKCPRGARPGDVLGALRREAIRYFAFPRFVGAMVSNPKALPLLFLVPALIFAAIAFWAPKPVGAPPFEYGSFFPASILEPLFFAVSGFALLAFSAGLVRFGRAIKAAGNARAGIVGAAADIATHQRFAECDDSTMRWGHMLTFWGFLGLALVGTAAGIGTMAGVLHTPLALSNPIKIFANLSAVVAFAGLALLVTRRSRAERATYFDWFFLATLFSVVFTGILSELLRLAHAGAMYGVYFVHLVLVFGLLLYAPYSKFAHLAYRTVALACSPKPDRRT